jgi:methylase of polypeptide subunit release factors
MPEVWASGDGYEAYVGRWSRLVAAGFLTWLGTPSARRWLDVGCGTGALAAAILDGAPGRRLEPTEVARSPHATHIRYLVGAVPR